MKERHKRTLEDRINYLMLRKGKDYVNNLLMDTAEKFRLKFSRQLKDKEEYAWKQYVYVYKKITSRYIGVRDKEIRLKRKRMKESGYYD